MPSIEFDEGEPAAPPIRPEHATYSMTATKQVPENTVETGADGSQQITRGFAGHIHLRGLSTTLKPEWTRFRCAEIGSQWWRIRNASHQAGGTVIFFGT